MSLQAFESTLIKLTAIQTRYFAKMKSGDEYLKTRNAVLFKKNFPKKKKFDWELFKANPECAAWTKRVNEKIVPSFGKVWRARIEVLKNKLWDLAKDISAPKGNEFLLWRSHSSGTWNSQGFGASKYAENAAQKDADIARAEGLEVEIRAANKHTESHYGIHHADFEVWVKTMDLGISILNYKPDLPLIERVRLYWKRGCNPRVDMYWLPYEFEEKNGLDYFGGYVTQKTS